MKLVPGNHEREEYLIQDFVDVVEKYASFLPGTKEIDEFTEAQKKYCMLINDVCVHTEYYSFVMLTRDSTMCNSRNGNKTNRGEIAKRIMQLSLKGNDSELYILINFNDPIH